MDNAGARMRDAGCRGDGVCEKHGIPESMENTGSVVHGIPESMENTGSVVL